MFENLKTALILTGLGVATGAVLGVLLIIIDRLKEKISEQKYPHAVKHRFDKPPTAKCYCKDCRFHSNEYNKCCIFTHQYTADTWFCCFAAPKDRR